MTQSFRFWAIASRKRSFPKLLKWTLSFKKSSGLENKMSGWCTIFPSTPKVKVFINLLTNFRTLSIFGGGPYLQWRLSLMHESTIFIRGKFWWSSSRSLFIDLTSSTLLAHPRSLPPQWITRTSGAVLLLRHWWKKGSTPSQHKPPLPNHMTWADSPRLLPMVCFARASPRRT